jgi:hypothetical protein
VRFRIVILPSLDCAMSSVQEIKALEEAFKESSWLRNDTLEPTVGKPECPRAAEKHGINGMSCYTALVIDHGDKDKRGQYGCRYQETEECRKFRVGSLEDAVRHVRSLHFGHKPFGCTSW